MEKSAGNLCEISTSRYLLLLVNRVYVATYHVWPTEFCRIFEGVRFFSRLTCSLTRPPVAHFFVFLIKIDCHQKPYINQRLRIFSSVPYRWEHCLFGDQ